MHNRLDATLLTALAAAFFTLPGCCANAPDPPPAPPGVPADATWLAGGNRIDVQAPAEGEIYLVVKGEVQTIRRVVAGERFLALGDPNVKEDKKEKERPRGEPLLFDHADAYFVPREFEKSEQDNR